MSTRTILRMVAALRSTLSSTSSMAMPATRAKAAAWCRKAKNVVIGASLLELHVADGRGTLADQANGNHLPGGLAQPALEGLLEHPDLRGRKIRLGRAPD